MSLLLLKSLNPKYATLFPQCLIRTRNLCQKVAKPMLRQTTNTRKIGPIGWFLLIIPASTFSLGTWQIQRKKWKEDLIAKLKELTNLDPIKLPENLDDLKELEYRPVHVRGRFLHDKEIYMGPRGLLVRGDASTNSQLISSNTNKSQGYLVITPFKLSNRDETILINRGWVPAKHKHPTTRQNGQISDEVDVVGIVRLHENRPQFSPQNQDNLWFYRDLKQMSQIAGTAPVFLDAINDFDVPEGPIGGQTRISLRNEHLSYVFTWYSLCAATSYLWYKQFLVRVK